MNPAEVFFRVGSSLGGWLIAYAYGILLAVVPATPCAERARPDEVWFAVWVFSFPALGALWLIPKALPWRDLFRWFALPLAPLLAYGVAVAWPALASVTLGGAALCADAGERAGWHPYWAPLQLLLIAGLAWRSVEYWLSSSTRDRGAAS